MKKFFLTTIMISFLFFFAACSENGNNLGGSISPFKNFDTKSKLDCISFGVRHELSSWSTNDFINEEIDTSELDMEYLYSPLGKTKLSLLDEKDIINLGILDEKQKDDFEDYVEQTKGGAFKISFCILNDSESGNYGKQIIWITNLGYIKNKKTREKLGYNLFYESKVLDFTDILDVAKESAKVDEFERSFLNSDFEGIYLHNYSKREETTVLNFYVMKLDKDLKASLVKFDLTVGKK